MSEESNEGRETSLEAAQRVLSGAASSPRGAQGRITKGHKAHEASPARYTPVRLTPGRTPRGTESLAGILAAPSEQNAPNPADQEPGRSPEPSPAAGDPWGLSPSSPLQPVRPRGTAFHSFQALGPAWVASFFPIKGEAMFYH